MTRGARLAVFLAAQLYYTVTSPREPNTLSFAAACSAPTSTEPVADPGAGPSREETVPTCRSGYAIANRNGEWVCEPIEEQQSSTSSETGS